MNDLAQLTSASIQIAEQHPTLNLLILFGSRARGDHSCSSDWDITFLSDPSQEDAATWFSGADLLLTLSEKGHIPSDSRSERLHQRLDLIDLSTCSDTSPTSSPRKDSSSTNATLASLSASDSDSRAERLRQRSKPPPNSNNFAKPSAKRCCRH